MHDVPAAEAATWTAPTAGTIEWGRLLGGLVGSRKVLSEASAIICLSEAERRTIQAQHPHALVELIPNGVAVARFSTGNGQAFQKRDFRRLWIIRINAAARAHEISYSQMMAGLKRAGIALDRKSLAEIAARDDSAFGRLVQAAKSAPASA